MFIRKKHKDKPKKEVYVSERQIALMKLFDKYSLLFDWLLACFLCFFIEALSRHSLLSAITFVTHHTLPYLYNSLIIYTTLSICYLFNRRYLVRMSISGIWLFLGVANSCILAKRVTPFGFTDLSCLSDLFAMKNTSYFTFTEALLIFVLCGGFAYICKYVGQKTKAVKITRKRNRVVSALIVAAICFTLSLTTNVAKKTNVIASYFSNIAKGYEDYGFVYGFSTSVVDRGMKKPETYSQEKINSISSTVTNSGEKEKAETVANSEETPNIIVVLLESFVNPNEINFLNCSTNPVPNFTNIYNNFSSGHLTVPVIGAGTANTEFEILTGMELAYFGTGEYPYKTRLKDINCESIASDLSQIGYGTHALHNNGGNFYSRRHVFSQMGFDSFTSKECMNIQEYTPLGSWATDHILLGETTKILDSTANQSDFLYTITVQTHGDYPEEKILENPAITVSGAESEGKNNSYEYYVNMLHEQDKFIGDLIDELSNRDEKTMVVFFGDHLPTLGLTDEDMATGDIFKTQYAIWDNFGLEKQDKDLKSYQLLAHATNMANIHEGTMFNYTQQHMENPDYEENMENLQYDILYGDRFVYGGIDKYPASNLIMDVEPVEVTDAIPVGNEYINITGKNFTPWTRIYVNESRVSATFIDENTIQIEASDLSHGDSITAEIYGSSNTLFRQSLPFIYVDLSETTESEF